MNQFVEFASLFRTWSRLSPPVPENSPTWQPVDAIVQAALVYSQRSRDLLGSSLTQSNRLFSPFCDPLRCDLGLHRWLATQREESYSDWLDWFINELKDAAQVLRLFGVTDDALLTRCNGCAVETNREEWILDGRGRLDIVVRERNSKAIVLVIEVKKTSAEDADTEKQKDYDDWLKVQLRWGEEKVLLIVEGDEEESAGGFRVVTWDFLALQLRLAVLKLPQDFPYQNKAMMLAFIAAVEQNLLDLHGLLGAQELCGPSVIRTNEHIQRFLREANA